MFDISTLGDAELIEALRAKTRAEAAAASERLELIAAVVARHCDHEDEASARCAIDGWAYAAAEISAACGLSERAASGQMRIAVALRDRLPKVAGQLAAGEISAKTAAAISWRTRLVDDDEALALVDAALAGIAPTLGVLSQENVENAIDVWVEKFDPAAVRRTRSAVRGRDMHFGNADDPAGTVSIWGRLLALDAIALRARLDGLAATVCGADPRTMGQRRSDAMGLLGVRPDAERLTCLCGDSDCDAAGKDPRSGAVTIYVLTDTVPGAPQDPPPPAPNPEPTPGPTTTGSPAVTPGGAIIPAPQVAELAAAGVRVTPLASVDLAAEPGYRPSPKLADWVRLRDLTCSFPGCHRSAQRCDVDHSVPWPAGATHPGNLSVLCRTHHLIKTFGNWTKTQHPDGSHTWTSPSGHAYTTVPMSRILFPDRFIDTPPPPPKRVDHTERRGLAMPQRRRTRARTEATRVAAERRINQELTKPPPY